MAILLGTSGAWAAIEAALQSRCLEASHPRDLALLLQKTRLRQQQGIDPLYLAFDEELEKLGKYIDQLHRQFTRNAALRTQTLTEAIAQAEQKLSEYHSRPWILRWTTLLFPILRMRSRKKMIQHRKEQAVQKLQADLTARRQEFTDKRQNRNELVRRRLEQIADNVAFLEQMLRSSELGGASAELEVIDCLRTLPDTYFICSDLNLRAGRKIRFNGEYLQTAQIDHLVVGPGGVFVLEVKRWSRQFVESGQFFDPYEQVARASYLCYDLLRWHLPGIRVRSILVNCGILPPCRDDFHVKMVTLPQLRGYVTYFRKPVLDKEQVDCVIKILRG